MGIMISEAQYDALIEVKSVLALWSCSMGHTPDNTLLQLKAGDLDDTINLLSKKLQGVIDTAELQA